MVWWSTCRPTSDGTAERDVAAQMLADVAAWQTVTVGADKAYDA